MGQVKLSGTVSDFRERTEISGTANSVSQTSTMHFRIDGRPVSLQGAMSISNGDRVTAICRDRAEPVVVAILNHTTQVHWGPNWKLGVWLAVAMIAGSLPLMFHAGGWVLLLLFGVLVLWGSLNSKRMMSRLGN